MTEARTFTDKDDKEWKVHVGRQADLHGPRLISRAKFLLFEAPDEKRRLPIHAGSASAFKLPQSSSGA
jgi:hypothetical protein